MHSLRALGALLRDATALEVYRALQLLAESEGGHALAEKIRLAPPAVWDGSLEPRPLRVAELRALMAGKSSELLQEVLEEAAAAGSEGCRNVSSLLRRARWQGRRVAVAHA